MTRDGPQAMPEDYWSNVEEYREEETEIDLAPGVTRGDLEESVVDHIRERTDEMWDLKGVMLSDTDGETMYILVVRSGIGDSGDLLIDERYFSYDSSDPYRDGTGYSSNGITRNISGEGMLLGLRVIYSAIADGLEDMQPQVMAAENGKIAPKSDKLTEPVADLLGIPEPEEEPEDPDRVECTRCGAEIDIEQAVQFGQGDLGDFWICDPDDPDLPCEEGSSDE